MTGHELPGIPGLLDAQLSLPELPTLPDLQIAPLRNPEPIKHNNAPIPLEPVAKVSNGSHQRGPGSGHRSGKDARLASNITPNDVLLAREAKKPHLAISELVQSNQDELQLLQLPSFVSLSVVEKSPIPRPSQIHPHKRIRLENDTDGGAVEINRVLPRPSKKDKTQARPVPLLPAMVTGLHEPPPSAGLLPSMSDARPDMGRSTNVSKMNVKEILAENKQASKRRPPEAMLNSPDIVAANLPYSNKSPAPVGQKHDKEKDNELLATSTDNKSRRQYRKWTDQETADLVAGVKKYGSGKWKQILSDPTLSFGKRTAVDLKDRYRVLPKDMQHRHSSPKSGEPSHAQSDSQDTTSSVPLFETPSSSPRHRKKRQRWTLAEDTALMAGVAKHGFQWSAIHSDPEMEWGSRRPTDLRDRIRTLFPEGYKQADTRPLAKERDKSEKPHRISDEAPEWKDTSPQSSRLQKATRADTNLCKDKTTGDNFQDIGEIGGRSKDTRDSVQAEHAGITLPSLALDDDDMEWDNRLPPLLDWEEI